MTRELLDHARRMIEGPDGPSGTWPRAAAFLTRQALEEALDDVWSATLPAMRHTNRFTQLSCLGQIVDDETLIRDVRSAWSSLSRACHYHYYELAPTAPELERWVSQAGRLVRALEQSQEVSDGQPTRRSLP